MKDKENFIPKYEMLLDFYTEIPSGNKVARTKIHISQEQFNFIEMVATIECDVDMSRTFIINNLRFKVCPIIENVNSI